MKKRLRINGIIMVCAAIVVAFLPKAFFRNNVNAGIGEYIGLLGFPLILLGQIIRVSARGYKAEHSCESRALIQDGPYQVVRNPMYLGILLIGSGVVLVVFKLWVLAIFLTVFVIRYIVLIHQEEKKLLAVFPAAYQAYRKKVPRILPKLSAIINLNINAYLPVKISWFKKEMGSIISLLLLTLLVASWEGIYQAGIRFYLRQAAWLCVTFILFIVFIILLSKLAAKRDASSANKS
jgi:protein-S-isoprenylcysteine O-methyltransferase Ste14